MASRRLFRAALVVSVAASLSAPQLGVGPALAGNAAGPSIESVRQELTVLEAEAAAAAQRHDEAQRAVEDGMAELSDVQREAAATRARLESSKHAVGRLAAASYRTGAIDPSMLRVLFADDAEDALHQAASVVRVFDRQNGVIERVTKIGSELERDEQRLASQVAELEADRDLLAREKQTVEQKSAAARKLLSTLEAQERERVAAEAARAAAAARSVQRPSRSASRPAGGAAVAVVGDCPPSGSRGAEAGLTPSTLSVMRCGLAAFPQIQSAGGLGNRGNATDHDNGRAVDFMIPNYRSAAGNDLGWAVAEWATKQPNVTYVIFDQMIFGNWAPGRGWTRMENRGSDTANHRDHVHVSVGR